MDKMKELLEKANECETAEELVALCKKYDFEISLRDADLYLNHYDEGEVDDENMDLVSGGESIFLGDNATKEVPFSYLKIGMYIGAIPKTPRYEHRKGNVSHIDKLRKIATVSNGGNIYFLPASAYKYIILI